LPESWRDDNMGIGKWGDLRQDRKLARQDHGSARSIAELHILSP